MKKPNHPPVHIPPAGRFGFIIPLIPSFFNIPKINSKYYFIANVFDFEKYKGFVYNVSEIDDVNELYIITDVLITDYSSVFFDYANLKRPMIFYMYDLEHYRDKSNGFYIDLDELPGNIVETQEDLEKEILALDKNFVYDEKYKKFNEKYNYLDDGNASMRVVNKII